MLRVEQDDAELFDRLAAELRHQEFGDVARREDLRALAPAADERPAARFDRRDELTRARRADSTHAAKVVYRRADEPVQSADGSQDGVRELEGARPRQALSKHDGEQLVVAEPARADAFEFLTRTIVWRNGLHLLSSADYAVRTPLRVRS